MKHRTDKEQEIQDLKQALVVSRLMIEKYRSLFVNTYIELGRLGYEKKN